MDFFERKLDDKNRLTIPAELRRELAEGVVIAPGFGPYLHLYPKKVWDEEMETALSGAGWEPQDKKPLILNQELADLNEQLRYGKVASALDTKQGRVTLEPHLLSYAGIERDVAAVRIPTSTGSYWRLRTPR